MECEECMESEQVFICQECEETLCSGCDAMLHKGGKRKSHLRARVCKSCRTAASEQCTSCDQFLCAACSSGHSGHTLMPIAPPLRLGVFWDMGSCRPVRAGDVAATIAEITQQLGKPSLVRVYGDTWGKFREACQLAGAESVESQGMRDLDLLLFDIPLLSSSLTHVLLISGQADSLADYLSQLRSSLSSVSLTVAKRVLPLQFSALPEPRSKPRRGVAMSNASEVVAEVQRTQRAPAKVKDLIDYLQVQARTGHLTHNTRELVPALCTGLSLSKLEVLQLIEEAKKSEVILVTKREFEEGVFEFVSLKLSQLSLECLLWTLRSLCKDEMLPTEKSIQARMKEAFDLKPTTAQWHSLLQKTRGQGHAHSLSAPTESALGDLQGGMPKFEIREMFEPDCGDVLLVYPRHEDWMALDQHSKYGDFLNLKGTSEWNDFLGFIHQFFKKSKETRSIPGGRYGCAQFLKLCGPHSLRGFSLGRLSYLVQLAINDDILRYQRTFLIYTEDLHNSPQETEVQSKLRKVQQAILMLLAKNPEGFPLAQVPFYVRKSLSFPLDISELGFPKLKDLLMSIPEVSVEAKGSNQPFAILKRSNEQEIVALITSIMKLHPFGILIERLEEAVAERRGMNVNWRTFRVSSFKEFIHQKVSHMIDLIPTGDSCKVFAKDEPQVNFNNLADAPEFKSRGSSLHADSPLFTPQKAYKARTDSVQFRGAIDLWAGHARVQSAFLMPDGQDTPAFCLENLGMAPPPGFE